MPARPRSAPPPPEPWGRSAASAAAQDKFPVRDVNWIIYQAPGGSIDTTARVIQPYLEKQGIKTNLEYVSGRRRTGRAQQALSPPAPTAT